MFEELRIKKFQGYANAVFKFVPGINVILGLSTVGKTAVLRALRLVKDNRPSGAEFFPNFEKENGETEIELICNNGRVLITKDIRVSKVNERKVKSTTYELDCGKKFSFTGVGEDVPDQVREFLNLSELNFQWQFDTPFLVSSTRFGKTSGDVTRLINEITKLEKVEEWESKLTTKINSFNQRLVVIKDAISAAENGLKKYEGLDDLGVVVDKLKKTVSEYNSLSHLVFRLDGSLKEYEEQYRSLEKLKKYSTAEKYVLRAEKIQSEIDKIDSLDESLKEYDKIAGALGKKRAVVSELDELLSRIKDLEFDEEKYLLLKNLLGGIEEKAIKISKLKERQGFLQSEYEEFFESGRCPVCFSEISEEKRKEIAKSL